MSSAKRRFVNVLPPMLTVPWCFSSASVIILLRKILKRVGEQTFLSHPNCGLEPFSNVLVEVNSTAGLVVEVSYDADGVSIDIVVVYCLPKCSMPHSVECRFEVNK